MRVLRIVVLCVIVALSSRAAPTAAEQPTPVIDSLAADGVFVHTRRAADVERERLVAVVSDARALGYRMAIVVPLDPLPELRAFVLRIQQGGEFDIVFGYGIEGEIEASTSDRFSNSDRLSALSATRDTTGSAEELSARFLTELTTDPPATVPDMVETIIRWVVILVIVLGIAIAFEQLWRTRSRRGRDRTAGQSSPLA